MLDRVRVTGASLLRCNSPILQQLHQHVKLPIVGKVNGAYKEQTDTWRVPMFGSIWSNKTFLKRAVHNSSGPAVNPRHQEIAFAGNADLFSTQPAAMIMQTDIWPTDFIARTDLLAGHATIFNKSNISKCSFCQSSTLYFCHLQKSEQWCILDLIVPSAEGSQSALPTLNNYNIRKFTFKDHFPPKLKKCSCLHTEVQDRTTYNTHLTHPHRKIHDSEGKFCRRYLNSFELRFSRRHPANTSVLQRAAKEPWMTTVII